MTALASLNIEMKGAYGWFSAAAMVRSQPVLRRLDAVLRGALISWIAATPASPATLHGVRAASLQRDAATQHCSP